MMNKEEKALFELTTQMHHDAMVVMQAVLIEWKHGRGAEAALQWIVNTLRGPGLLPDPDAPYGKEAQAFFDANVCQPLPTCTCGRPSNIAWMGKGFCCEAHYAAARAASLN